MNKLYASLFFSAYTFTAFAQWNSDPSINNLVCTQARDQQDVRIVSDTKGGAIMSWVDFRNDQNEIVADIFAQRVNSNGTNMWTNNGVAVCTNNADQTASVLTEDGVGGTIITWQDWRNGNRDIFAQRIDSSGNVLWTTDGVGVAIKNYHQQGPRIISDGAQGAIIVWEDSVNGNWDIFAQRINNNGVSQWTAGGIAVCTASQNQVNPKIVGDATGATYIVWQDRRNGNDYDIYCQKLNASGQAQWTNNGVAVCTSGNSQINPKMVLDYSGAIIISWQHFNTGAGYDIYAQRVNSSGIVQWTTNGIQVCAQPNNQSAIDMTSQDITNGVIISWKDARNANNVNIYCQKIDFSGNMIWTANGVLISNASRNQINPNIIGDGNGGGIVVWQDSIAGIWDVYAQRISSLGTAVWASGGVAVGIAADNQTGPKNIRDGAGGSIFAFQDKRSGDFDIYAYKLSGNGTVTSIEQQSASQDAVSVFPNPFSEHTIVYFSEGKHHIRIYDLAGREILTIPNITNNSYSIEKGSLSSGTYLLTVNSEKTNYSKLIIIQ